MNFEQIIDDLSFQIHLSSSGLDQDVNFEDLVADMVHELKKDSVMQRLRETTHENIKVVKKILQRLVISNNLTIVQMIIGILPKFFDTLDSSNYKLSLPTSEEPDRETESNSVFLFKDYLFQCLVNPRISTFSPDAIILRENLVESISNAIFQLLTRKKSLVELFLLNITKVIQKNNRNEVYYNVAIYLKVFFMQFADIDEKSSKLALELVFYIFDSIEINKKTKSTYCHLMKAFGYFLLHWKNAIQYSRDPDGIPTKIVSMIITAMKSRYFKIRKETTNIVSRLNPSFIPIIFTEIEQLLFEVFPQQDPSTNSPKLSKTDFTVTDSSSSCLVSSETWNTWESISSLDIVDEQFSKKWKLLHGVVCVYSGLAFIDSSKNTIIFRLFLFKDLNIGPITASINAKAFEALAKLGTISQEDLAKKLTSDSPEILSSACHALSQFPSLPSTIARLVFPLQFHPDPSVSQIAFTIWQNLECSENVFFQSNIVILTSHLMSLAENPDHSFQLMSFIGLEYIFTFYTKFDNLSIFLSAPKDFLSSLYKHLLSNLLLPSSLSFSSTESQELNSVILSSLASFIHLLPEQYSELLFVSYSSPSNESSGFSHSFSDTSSFISVDDTVQNPLSGPNDSNISTLVQSTPQDLSHASSISSEESTNINNITSNTKHFGMKRKLSLSRSTSKFEEISNRSTRTSQSCTNSQLKSTKKDPTWKLFGSMLTSPRKRYISKTHKPPIINGLPLFKFSLTPVVKPTLGTRSVHKHHVIHDLSNPNFEFHGFRPIQFSEILSFQHFIITLHQYLESYPHNSSPEFVTNCIKILEALLLHTPVVVSEVFSGILLALSNSTILQISSLAINLVHEIDALYHRTHPKHSKFSDSVLDKMCIFVQGPPYYSARVFRSLLHSTYSEWSDILCQSVNMFHYVVNSPKMPTPYSSPIDFSAALEFIWKILTIPKVWKSSSCYTLISHYGLIILKNTPSIPLKDYNDVFPKILNITQLLFLQFLLIHENLYPFQFPPFNLVNEHPKLWISKKLVRHPTLVEISNSETIILAAMSSYCLESCLKIYTQSVVQFWGVVDVSKYQNVTRSASSIITNLFVSLMYFGQMFILFESSHYLTLPPAKKKNKNKRNTKIKGFIAHKSKSVVEDISMISGSSGSNSSSITINQTTNSQSSSDVFGIDNSDNGSLGSFSARSMSAIESSSGDSPTSKTALSELPPSLISENGSFRSKPSPLGTKIENSTGLVGRFVSSPLNNNTCSPIIKMQVERYDSIFSETTLELKSSDSMSFLPSYDGECPTMPMFKSPDGEFSNGSNFLLFSSSLPNHSQTPDELSSEKTLSREKSGLSTHSPATSVHRSILSTESEPGTRNNVSDDTRAHLIELHTPVLSMKLVPFSLLNNSAKNSTGDLSVHDTVLSGNISSKNLSLSSTTMETTDEDGGDSSKISQNDEVSGYCPSPLEEAKFRNFVAQTQNNLELSNQKNKIYKKNLISRFYKRKSSDLYWTPAFVTILIHLIRFLPNLRSPFANSISMLLNIGKIIEEHGLKHDSIRYLFFPSIVDNYSSVSSLANLLPFDDNLIPLWAADAPCSTQFFCDTCSTNPFFSPLSRKYAKIFNHFNFRALPALPGLPFLHPELVKQVIHPDFHKILTLISTPQQALKNTPTPIFPNLHLLPIRTDEWYFYGCWLRLQSFDCPPFDFSSKAVDDVLQIEVSESSPFFEIFRARKLYWKHNIFTSVQFLLAELIRFLESSLSKEGTMSGTDTADGYECDSPEFLGKAMVLKSLFYHFDTILQYQPPKQNFNDIDIPQNVLSYDFIDEQNVHTFENLSALKISNLRKTLVNLFENPQNNPHQTWRRKLWKGTAWSTVLWLTNTYSADFYSDNDIASPLKGFYPIS